MTEPDDEPPSTPDEPESLGTLKESDTAADTNTVEDGVGSRSRWNWNPVTEAGGAPSTANEEPSSGFQFDLGRALARLDGDEPDPSEMSEPVVVAPIVEQPDSPESVAIDVAGQVDEPVPTGVDPTPDVEPVVASEPSAWTVSPGVEPVVASEPSAWTTSPEVQAEPTEPDPYAELDQAPLPRRSRPSTPVANSAPVVPQPVRPLDPVAERQPDIVTGPRTPTNVPAAESSVFGAAAPAPVLPPRSTQNRMPTSPSDQASLSARVASLPPTDAGALPTLPAANPVAPPPMVAPVQTAPSTPDLNALRSAQLRANRQQRKGNILGHSILAFAVIGVLVAGALFFGRSYLFPNQWDAELTPIVDEIERAAGVEFDHNIELITQAPDEYAKGLLAATIGTDWIAEVPEWRALGLATGDITAEQVAAALAARTPAYYDPVTDAIYRQEDRSDVDTRRGLESALAAAFHHQLSTQVDDVVVTDQPRFTGVSTPQSIAAAAVDAYLAERTAEKSFIDEATGDQADPEAPVDPVGELPIPIAYELAAIDQLGEPILSAAGVDAATLQAGAAYPAAIYGVLDDAPTGAPSPLLRDGEQPLADSVALGGDDWALIWGGRLPGPTVDRLNRIITADSYRPISRGDTTCFVALLQTATEIDGTSLYSSMLLWAQRAPIGSQALATPLGPTQVQLEACDPGAAVVIMPDMVTVDSLIERQTSRLGG